MKKQFTVIDLFCGAGGFSEGFRQAGFKIIWAVDRWKLAVDTHQENHPESQTLCDDVIRLSKLPDIAFHSIIPDSDVIIGSPPCTYFSNSNRSGNGDVSEGKELIKAFLRIVARKKFKRGSILKYWILENVPKVRPHIKSSYTAQQLGIKGQFTLKVKSPTSQEYNAKYFGVPSNRIRYFCGEFPAPIRTILNDDGLIPLKAILSQLGDPKEKVHDQITDPLYPFQMNGEDVTDHHYIQELAEFESEKILRLKQDKGYMGKMAVPENPEKPARTIMATMSFTSRECFVLGHSNNQLRAPTIREVASLMSFPIDYRFYGTSLGTKYKLVGNAVPPKLAFAFAKAILNAEQCDCPSYYIPIHHAQRVDFMNLNFDEIAVKEEKRKRITTRFRYHIPKFKFDTYRVELTNHHSNFERRLFKWDTEIHYNQGKDKAKVYVPKVTKIDLTNNDTRKLELFLTRINKHLVSFYDFQLTYCMTTKEIRKNHLVGPYELLEQVKQFIQHEFSENLNDYVTLECQPHVLPKPIALGYVILSGCLDAMRKIPDGQSKQIRHLWPSDEFTNTRSKKYP
jgi:DNA (cytosine-5)-methyltransferase 1